MDDQEGGRAEVHILLALYNGATDLQAQLDSIAAQRHDRWHLTVSDDGSRDAGPDLVRRFSRRMARRGHQVRLVAGPQAGSAANFLALIAALPARPVWVALSDQDDVWLPDRLSRGMAALAALPAARPTLYCSRTWITDAALNGRRLSAGVPYPPSFANALVQNIAAGNTILLNPAAAVLARTAAPTGAAVPGLPAHDWWLYQLITGTGGTVIHDPEPTLLYRQHDDNQIGANDSWRARFWRLRMLVGGRFAAWNSANIAAMRLLGPRLTAPNLDLLENFAALRDRPLAARLRGFARLRLFRQGRIGQATLWLAVLLGRL